MGRISKRVREEAALICAIAASNDDQGVTSAGLALDVSRDAIRLALDAQSAACRWRVLLLVYSQTYAEAEALLRTGWMP